MQPEVAINTSNLYVFSIDFRANKGDQLKILRRLRRVEKGLHICI